MGDSQNPVVFEEYQVLALKRDHVIMLAVWSHVIRDEEGKPNLVHWAQLADLPLDRVRSQARVLTDIGAVLPNGELADPVKKHLVALALALVS